MKEKKEGRVGKTLDSQVRISTRIRSLKVHRVLVSLQHRDQLRLTIVRLFYRHHQLLVHQEVLREGQLLLISHIMGGDIKECWRLTDACLACGSNEHKIKDCLRARSFTSPRTGGTVSAVQKSNKDNKSIASPSAPRQTTQTMGRQDARALVRAYAMKAVEEKDAPDVIVGKFSIFETNVYALIDPSSTHSYICTAIPSLGSLPKSETEYDILVKNPLRHSVIVNRVYRYCPIRIQEYEFPGDLIELSFKEFDVILGMDWLSRHQVVVDYRMKRVTLRTPSGEEVTFIGERSNHLSNVISIATARMMV